MFPKYWQFDDCETSIEGFPDLATVMCNHVSAPQRQMPKEEREGEKRVDTICSRASLVAP